MIIIIVMTMMLLTIIVMGRWVLETPLRGCCILWITTDVLAWSNEGAPSSSNREAGLLTTRPRARRSIYECAKMLCWILCTNDYQRSAISPRRVHRLPTPPIAINAVQID
jgi:hypothetical protein